MTITHYLLSLLSVLCSSSSDGGLACFAALTILCLYVAHSTGGFLTVGDGFFSIEGLEPGFSTSNNPSSQSEELHQQCVLPHLSQNSQYLPRNLPSWYLNPWPTGTSVLDVFSLVCMFVILWSAFLFLVLTYLLLSAFSHAWYFSVLVWMSWIMLNFPHIFLTFTSTSGAPAGILQNRYPSRSQVVFNDLLNAILK